MELTKKQVTFRGIDIEELKQIDVREFAKYLNSRQKRYVLRSFHEIEDFMNRAREKSARNKPIRTHKRDLIIVPGMIGMKIHIYNGKMFVPVEITWDKLGHKFGEFSPSRARIKHGKAGMGATKGSKSKAKK
ncbi:MAG TPA: ribosomal protein S19 family protein [Candidatus Nanoarchaeia archaeon]|nr:30S ribosomal protein S19 [uncultured archaeon]HJZ18993.1 ribosomal protein S19 family protein [Candidatus Nanoarchaeia archaeon]